MTKQPKGWYVLYCEVDDYVGFYRYRYIDAIAHEKLWNCTHPHTLIRVHKEWTHPVYEGTTSIEQPKGWFVICCEADSYTTFRRFRYFDALVHSRLWTCNHPYTFIRVHKEWTHPVYKGEN